MNLNRRCCNSHRALAISPSPPETFDKCAMISWPPLKPRTAVGGAVANPSRPFLDIVEEEEENPVEYTMDFIQADIASETGSSGAPLLDGNGRVIGLLHGGFGGRFSYFVSHHDIVQFLMQSGILAN
uniref:Uncharacterized protein n=1 Tax=Avena sativa TaxID=4498 RepID=A0ACD5TX29_AVESA